MNLQIENFRNEILKSINNCGLPVGIAVYVMKDCYRDLLKAYDEVLEEEKIEAEKGTDAKTEEFAVDINNEEEK